MKPTLRIAKLSELQPDPHNANRHTERGRNMVERSLRERGFFRPMAAAGKGVEQPVMLAGNLTQETAVSIGMDEAIIVETDGTRPIVHVRTDVEPGSAQAILLGLEDNRAAEISLNLDSQVLHDYKLKLDLKPLWSDEEFKAKFGERTPEEAKVFGESNPHYVMEYRIVVECRDEEHQRELLERFEELQIQCRALIS